MKDNEPWNSHWSLIELKIICIWKDNETWGFLLTAIKCFFLTFGLFSFWFIFWFISISEFWFILILVYILVYSYIWILVYFISFRQIDLFHVGAFLFSSILSLPSLKSCWMNFLMLIDAVKWRWRWWRWSVLFDLRRSVLFVLCSHQNTSKRGCQPPQCSLTRDKS